MSIQIREMLPVEVKAVKKIGYRAFRGGIEKFFISKPKDAFVALIDDEIVGALLYKFFQLKGKKIGYVDFYFVEPEYHGQGIGNQLLQVSMNHMWAQGCDGISAIVKDDNVGSFGLFLKNGFTRVSFLDMTQKLGVFNAIKQYFSTNLFVAVGMEYYLIMKPEIHNINETAPTQTFYKGHTGLQLMTYLLVNLLLGLLQVIIRPDFGFYVLVGYGLLLLGMVVAGFIGTRFSKLQWSFRLMDGGAFISIVIHFFAFFPMIGNWYPKTYEKEPNFKKAMGMTALFQWLYILVFVILYQLELLSNPITQTMGGIASILVWYFMMAFYPYESFGGKRVFRWHPLIYGAMVVLSLGVIFVPIKNLIP